MAHWAPTILYHPAAHTGVALKDSSYPMQSGKQRTRLQSRLQRRQQQIRYH